VNHEAAEAMDRSRRDNELLSQPEDSDEVLLYLNLFPQERFDLLFLYYNAIMCTSTELPELMQESFVVVF
jgi:hypothetical protein